jgi:hypothetical protein
VIDPPGVRRARSHRFTHVVHFEHLSRTGPARRGRASAWDAFYHAGRTGRLPIARLRSPRPPRRGRSTCYLRDRNSRFHRYYIEPSANVGALIDEIDYDPTGIFRG